MHAPIATPNTASFDKGIALCTSLAYFKENIGMNKDPPPVPDIEANIAAKKQIKNIIKKWTDGTS